MRAPHIHTQTLGMARSYLPPGFRFSPTDEELVVYYLKKKVAGKRVKDGVIGEIEIYKFEPADLPGLASLYSRDPEWYFFNAQDKKYLHGARTNRTTRAGYWKATGKDRRISAGSCTGLKKTLIYYAGRAPHGERTDWVMHEYRLDEEYEKKMNCPKSYVLCRIRRKGGLGPRNGEQYGAPVFDENEEGLSTSYPLEEACELAPADTEIVEGQVLETPHVPIDEGFSGDYIDSFLRTLISVEEQQQQPVQDEVLSLDDLLVLTDNLEDFAVMEPAHTGPTNLVDNFCDLLHPADNESVILQETPDGFNVRMALQEPSYSQAWDDVHNGGFIELADLEEPCNEQGLESADMEELFYELNKGVDVEIPMSTGLAHERLQVQSLQPFGDRQSSRGLQYLGGSGMGNERLALEVPLDSSQGLNILDSIYTRLLTSDDGGGFSDDLPSGCHLNPHQEGGGGNSTASSHQEGVFGGNSTSSLHQGGGFGGNSTSSPHQEEGFSMSSSRQEGGNSTSSSHQEEGFGGNSTSSMAHSHSHSSSRADEPSEAQLVDNLPGGMNLDMHGGVHSVASVLQEETRVAHGERVAINSNTTPVRAHEQPNSTAGLLNNNTQLTSSVGSLARNHSSPSLFQRAISGFLFKADVFPASADEGEILKDSRKYFAAEGKVAQSAPTHPSSLSISSASLHFRVKLIDLEHSARTSEMELQWCVPHIASSTKPCKSFTNDLSKLIFRMTTLAVILFCMFRGFCRLTRSAFV